MRLNKEQQKEIIELVRGTENLIFRELEHAKVTEKGAADYVTNVDIAVQNYLKEELACRFPDIEMIAEEKKNENLKRDGQYWILDPIDGTTNLIHHYGMSAVSLGLYDAGEIIFGVVYNPFHKEMFYAAKGEGAFRNEEAIHVNDRLPMKDSVVCYGSSPYEKARAAELFRIFYRIHMKCADFRRSGSAALDLCYVAAGRQAAFLEQNLKPWDYAAGSLIVTEAGGVIKNWEGEKLPYLENSDIFSAAPQIENDLFGLLRE